MHRHLRFLVCLLLLAPALLLCKKKTTDPLIPPVADFEASFSSSTNQLLIGACYYPWYTAGQHWGGSYMRAKLAEPQPPLLGEYDCAKAEVISQHVQWSVDAGIDFWVSSWWGPGSREDQVVLSGHLRNQDFRQNMGYCLLYETAGRLGGIPVNVTADKINRFLDDIEYLIAKHFQQPNYLKIDNQPVLYVYLTRTFNGNYQQLFYAADSLVKQHGYAGLYLVGDEVYWHQPNNFRAQYMDAITCYNPHTSVDWVTDADRFVTRTGDEMYTPWIALANTLSIPFWVDVLPGFNDLGVRIEAQHPVIERQNGETFAQMLQMAGNVLAQQTVPLKVMVITSFNEWHEDTQIEPTIVTTNMINQPRAYTSGLSYIGYGTKYLEAVKNFVQSYGN